MASLRNFKASVPVHHGWAHALQSSVSAMIYPLVSELSYKAPGGEGHGRMVSLCNTRVCFETDRPLASGSPIELSIAWPAAGNGSVRFFLSITGSVVANQSGRITVGIRRHAFRACAMAPQAISQQASR